MQSVSLKQEVLGLDLGCVHIAYDNGMVSKEEFCETNQQIIENEGWGGYRAIKVMWDGVPVDCSAYVDSEYLP
jgi:hypothetical protein